MNSIELFFKFLGVRDLTRQFYRNFILDGHHVPFENWAKHIDIENWVASAFCWSNTNEGREFWHAIDREWLTVLKGGNADA